MTLKGQEVLSGFKRRHGASVAQWSEPSPITSEIADSILTENDVDVTRTQSSTHVRVVGFLRALSFPPTGKLTGWVRINR